MSRSRFDGRDLAAIAAGGVAGAITRWLLTLVALTDDQRDGSWFAYQGGGNAVYLGTVEFPWPTLAANVLGCLVLGAVVALGRQGSELRRPLLMAGPGFCGAVTTFSTFSVEIAHLLRGPRRPAGAGAVLISGSTTTQAIWYLGLSIVAGPVSFVVGRAAIRGFHQ